MCGPSGGRIVRRPGVRSAPADGCLPRRQLDAVGSRRRSDSEHAEQRRPHRTVRRSRVDAEQAVEWLADESALTLLGDEAESTWLAWVQSDACADTFDAQGFGDAEPDPDLLVAAAIGLDPPDTAEPGRTDRATVTSSGRSTRPWLISRVARRSEVPAAENYLPQGFQQSRRARTQPEARRGIATT